MTGSFDLVFCRNVLIYFTPQGREQVAREILQRLHGGGYLFLGHAETLTGMAETARNVIPAVYRAVAPSGRRG